MKGIIGSDDILTDGLPQVAFVGRSNVGKSSVINSLAGVEGLVKTGKKPGKTTEINFFLINRQFYFVDLPGYGYAKVPEEIRKKWGPMIEGYLSNRKDLKAVVFILDIRHLPTEDDKRMKEWLDYYKIPVIYVATKADKVKQREIEKQKFEKFFDQTHNLNFFRNKLLNIN